MPLNFGHNEENNKNLPEQNTELDRYGVWVKTPPRTIHDETETETESGIQEEKQNQTITLEKITDIETELSVSDDTIDAEEMIIENIQIEDIQLPDFEDFGKPADYSDKNPADSSAGAAMLPAGTETAAAENAVPEPVFEEQFDIPDTADTEETSDGTDLFEQLPEDIFTAEDIAQFTESNTSEQTSENQDYIEESSDAEVFTEPAVFEDEEISFDTFTIEEIPSGSETQPAEPETTVPPEFEEIPDSFEAEEIEIPATMFTEEEPLPESVQADEENFLPVEFTEAEPAEIFTEHAETDTPSAEGIPDTEAEEFSPEETLEAQFDIQNTVFTEKPETEETQPELAADTPAAESTEEAAAAAADFTDISSFSDGEISLDEFFDSPAPETSDNVSPDTASFADGDISLDAFFDGDSLSADDFMPSESKKEKSDILDEPSMDISLSFDDNFVMNTAADPVTQMEMMGTDTPANTEIQSDDNFDFDDMFDNIVDETQKEPEKSAAQEILEFDEVTDFDDLLDSITEPVPASSIPEKQESSRSSAAVDYDITVSTDDDLQEFNTVQTESDDDDTIEEIPLYGNSGIEKSEENEDTSLDRTQTSQYTTTAYTDDSDFDIDKIMAEVEDIGGENMPADTSDRSQNQEEQEETQSTENDIFDADFFESPQTDFADITTEDTDKILNSDQKFDISDFDVKEPEIDSIFSEENIEKEIFDIPADFTEPDTESVQETAAETDILVSEIIEPVFDEPVQEIISEPIFEASDETQQNPEEAEIPETGCYMTEEQIAQECPDQEAPEADNMILRQIAAELAALRAEISSLKNDFEDMKKHGIAAVSEDTDAAEGFFSGDTEDDTISLSGNELSNILNTADFTEEPAVSETYEQETEQETEIESQPETEIITESEVETEPETESIPESEPETEGFFDENTEDETIALSGNELTNILNTADFTEEPAVSETYEPEAADEYEESDNGLPVIDFEAEKLEEPVLENIDFSIGTDNEIPEEIEVPKIEDILVESSDTDLIENDAASESAVFMQDEEEPETAEDAEFEAAETEPEIEIEEAEEEISDEPTEEMFKSDQWETPEIQPQETEEEQNTEIPDEEEHTEPAGIPGRLKEEIKSVLTYMDQLLENLPEEKIAEFAQSEHFELYKKLFTELGLS